MPRTEVGKVAKPKPKKEKGQPSQRVLEGKKGGAVNISPVKPPKPAASPGKEDVLRGTTSGSGVKLTTSVTRHEKLIDQQAELKDDPVAFIESDRLFHRAIVSAAGNPVLADFY